jgi:hypothetical protein
LEAQNGAKKDLRPGHAGGSQIPITLIRNRIRIFFGVKSRIRICIKMMRICNTAIKNISF